MPEEIIVEEIVHSEIKEQKPPETIPKQDIFGGTMKRDFSESVTADAHHDEIEKEIKLLNIIIYAIIVLLIIVMFFIIKY